MEFPELMNAFAAKFGVENIEIDNGVCAFEIDKTPVAFVEREDGDSFAAVAEIGTPPPDANGRFGEVMLKANFHLQAVGGTVICQDPETDAYVIMRRVRLADVDADSLAGMVEGLVNEAERWQGIVEGFRTAEEALADLESASPSEQEIATGSFISV